MNIKKINIKLLFLIFLNILNIDPVEKIDVYFKKFDSKIKEIVHCNDNKLIILTNFGTVYLSKDYGETWENINNLFNKSEIEIEDLMQNPNDKNHIIFITSINQIYHTLSCDKEISIMNNGLEMEDLLIHPMDKNHILGNYFKDCKIKEKNCIREWQLFFSKDQGKTWKIVQKNIKEYLYSKMSDFSFLSNKYRLFFIKEEKIETLYYTDDYFEKENIISKDVDEFLLTKRNVFIFKNKKNKFGFRDFTTSSFGYFYILHPILLDEKKNNNYKINILDTKTNGNQFLITTSTKGYYSISDLYFSDFIGSRFKLTLKDLVCNFNEEGCDFYSIESIEGVFIANTYKESYINHLNINIKSKKNHNSYVTKLEKLYNNIQTMITFDYGKTWSRINHPLNDIKNKKIKCKNCYLNLLLPKSGDINEKFQILSDINSPGIILANGTISKYLMLNDDNISLFITKDGGLNWEQILKGNYLFEIINSAGFILAAPKKKLTKKLKYSFDLGKTWKEILVGQENFYIKEIKLENLKKDHKFIIIGYKKKNYEEIGITITINLKDFHERDCQHLEDKEKSDYEEFMPKMISVDENKCFNGREMKFLRKKTSSLCYNNDKFPMMKIVKFCECTEKDWYCDFGFKRNKENNKCELITDLGENKEYFFNDSQGVFDAKKFANFYEHAPKICIGKYYKTSGYRKLPNSHCMGGVEHYGKEVDCPKNENEIKIVTINNQIKIEEVPIKKPEVKNEIKIEEVSIKKPEVKNEIIHANNDIEQNKPEENKNNNLKINENVKENDNIHYKLDDKNDNQHFKIETKKEPEHYKIEEKNDNNNNYNQHFKIEKKSDNIHYKLDDKKEDNNNFKIEEQKIVKNIFTPIQTELPKISIIEENNDNNFLYSFLNYPIKIFFIILFLILLFKIKNKFFSKKHDKKELNLKYNPINNKGMNDFEDFEEDEEDNIQRQIN